MLWVSFQLRKMSVHFDENHIVPVFVRSMLIFSLRYLVNNKTILTAKWLMIHLPFDTISILCECDISQYSSLFLFWQNDQKNRQKLSHHNSVPFSCRLRSFNPSGRLRLSQFFTSTSVWFSFKFTASTIFFF